MNAKTPPPRGLRWTDAPAGRAIVTVLALVTLVLTLYLGFRYQRLVDCLRDNAAADARRTAALAVATDAERIADRQLLIGGADPIELRKASLEARRVTDEVRASNPPRSVSCS